MSAYVATPTKTFTAGAAIGKYLRVKLSSGKLALAGAGASDDVNEIGVTVSPSFADGDVIAVHLRNATGTQKMVASAAITKDARVYGAANGKISSTPSGPSLGVAIEAATADGDVIEVLRFYGAAA